VPFPCSTGESAPGIHPPEGPATTVCGTRLTEFAGSIGLPRGRDETDHESGESEAIGTPREIGNADTGRVCWIVAERGPELFQS